MQTNVLVFVVEVFFLDECGGEAAEAGVVGAVGFDVFIGEGFGNFAEAADYVVLI